MDLQGIVRSTPRRARGDQLRHARIDIAALPAILLARGAISEFARHHDLTDHQRQLVRHAGEFQQRLSELAALCGIGQREIEGVPGDADGARRGLDARAFEGLHQLLEALPFLAAQQSVLRHRETFEAERIFAHPAIAEHLDLLARKTFVGEWIGFGAARLFGEQHGEAAIAGRVGIGAHQHGHQIGARGMGDPGLGAVDPPAALGIAPGPRAQRGEVRSRIGFGEDRGRQDGAIGEAGEEFRLLRLGPVRADQLARDLGAGAERSGTDPSARQFLRHERHRQLAQAEPAIILGDADPEHAESRHLVHELQRDQRVLEVPAMRVGRNARGCKGAELVANQVERFVAKAFAGPFSRRQPFGEFAA